MTQTTESRDLHVVFGAIGGAGDAIVREPAGPARMETRG